MTTLDRGDGGLVVHTKGAPEEVLARATAVHRSRHDVPLTAADRTAATRVMTDYAQQGLRVLAVAWRACLPGRESLDAVRRPSGT